MYKILLALLLFIPQLVDAQNVTRVTSSAQHPYRHHPNDLSINGSNPSDGQCLSYDSATQLFEWTTCGSGGASFGSVIVFHKDGTSTTYTASADTDAARGTALVNAITAATTDFDFISVGPGVFNTSTSDLNIDANVSICGSGREATEIVSTKSGIFPGNNNTKVLNMGGGSQVVCDMTITDTTGSVNAPIYHGNDGDIIIKNVDATGTSDVFYGAGIAGTLNIYIYDSVFRSTFDTFITGASGATFVTKIYNTDMIPNASSSGSPSRCYVQDSLSTMDIEGGTCTATGGSGAALNAVFSNNATSTYRIKGLRISSTPNGASEEYHLKNTSGSISISSDVIYDNTKTIGTIGYLTQNNTVNFNIVTGQVGSFITSFIMPFGTNPSVDSNGELAEDTTASQLLYGASPNVLNPVEPICKTFENLVAADDNMYLWKSPEAFTVESVSCLTSSFTTEPSITFEDGSGNAMTGSPACGSTELVAFVSITAGGALAKNESIRFDISNTPAPLTGTQSTICFKGRWDRQ